MSHALGVTESHPVTIVVLFSVMYVETEGMGDIKHGCHGYHVCSVPGMH